MKKYKYTLLQFYNDAIAVIEKHKMKVIPGQVFSTEIKLEFYKKEGPQPQFSIWYSNGLPEDDRKIASSNERTPELALLKFEADLIDTYDIRSSLIEYTETLI